MNWELNLVLDASKTASSRHRKNIKEVISTHVQGLVKLPPSRKVHIRDKQTKFSNGNDIDILTLNTLEVLEQPSQ